MNTSKNYVLQFLRESQKSAKAPSKFRNESQKNEEESSKFLLILDQDSLGFAVDFGDSLEEAFEDYGYLLSDVKTASIKAYEVSNSGDVVIWDDPEGFAILPKEEGFELVKSIIEDNREDADEEILEALESYDSANANSFWTAFENSDLNDYGTIYGVCKEIEVPAESMTEFKNIQASSSEGSKMKRDSFVRPTFEGSEEWYFNPSDMGMSGAATYTYAKSVIITDDSIMNDSNANIMGKEEIPGIINKESEESVFILLYDSYSKQFGYHYGIFLEDQEIMIYDYASSVQELEHKLKQDFLPYTNFVLNSADIEEFASKVAETQDISENVNESSKFYTFHVPCTASIVVNADSEELAKELLHKNTDIELTEYLEFGDIEIRAIDVDPSLIQSLEADEFDPES